MTFFLFLLLIVEFFYFYNRLDKVQEELRAYKEGRGEMPQASTPQQTESVIPKSISPSLAVPKPPIAQTPMMLPKAESPKRQYLPMILNLNLAAEYSPESARSR